MKTVFSIIGKKRSGKDTIADYICQKKGCKKYALAKPLKDLVCNIFGITMEQLDRYKNEAWGFDAFFLLRVLFPFLWITPRYFITGLNNMFAS